MRAALGAGRARLVRQFLAESILLGLLGGVAGLAAAFWCTRVLVALGPASIPRLAEVTIDLRVLGFTFATAVGTSMLFGLMPALSASGGAVASFIGSAGRGAIGPARLAHAACARGLRDGAGGRAAGRRRAADSQLRRAATREPGLRSGRCRDVQPVAA